MSQSHPCNLSCMLIKHKIAVAVSNKNAFSLIVKWLSPWTLNPVSCVRITVGEFFFFSSFFFLHFFFKLIPPIKYYYYCSAVVGGGKTKTGFGYTYLITCVVCVWGHHQTNWTAAQKFLSFLWTTQTPQFFYNVVIHHPPMQAFKSVRIREINKNHVQ